MRSHSRLALGAVCAVVLFGFFAIPACGSDDADTATGQGDEETTTTQAETTTTQAETTTTVPGTRTAVTTGATIMTQIGLDVEVAGGGRFPASEDVLLEIWPDGVQAKGVRVTIEEVDGEERITGRAE